MRGGKIGVYHELFVFVARAGLIELAEFAFAEAFLGGIAPVKTGGGYLFPYHHGAAFPAPETHLIRKNLNIGPAAGAFKDFNTQVSAFLTGTAAVHGSHLLSACLVILYDKP
jgi:hypothetical protein